MSFIKKTLLTFMTSIWLMLVGLLSGIISARILGPELKGQSALLVSITEFLFMFGSFGLGSAFSYYIAKKKYPSGQIMTFALVGAVIFGTIAVGLFYTSIPFHRKVWEGVPSLLIFLSALLSIFAIYNNYLTRIIVGFGQIYEMNAAGISSSLANLLSVVVLLWVMGYGLYGMVGVFWISSLTQVAVLLFFLRKKLVFSCFWKNDLILNCFSYGIKSQALLLINFLNYRLDIFLVKYFLGVTSVGYYSLAVGLGEMMWMVPNSAIAPLFSSIAGSESSDRSLVTLRTVRWSLLLLFIMAIGGGLFGQFFIKLLYGADFLPSYNSFLLLLPGICLFPIFKLLVVDLAGRGHPGLGTISSLVALLINISANILLIPKMGAPGAALATSISYTCMSILSLLFFLHVTKYRIFDVFIFDRYEFDIVMKFIYKTFKMGRKTS